MEMLYSGYMHSYCTHHFFLCGTLAETPPGAHEEQSADDHKEADTTNGPADRSGTWDKMLAVNIATLRRCSDLVHSRVVSLLSFPRSTARVIVATDAEVMVTTLPAELVVVRVLHGSSVTDQKDDYRPKLQLHWQ
jgi:hypothetical protein